MTLARVRIAQGQAEAVVPLLERLLADAEMKARMHSAIEILILQALALHAQGDLQRALAALARALALAAPEGYVRIFADEGRAVADLLAQGLATPGWGAGGPSEQYDLHAYARRLLQAM